MTEKEFINKIHKALPREMFKWKIRDSYHGGVPDAYYSGPAGCVFVEYKYQRKIPVNGRSKIPIKTTAQQKQWLRTAISHSVPAYVVIGAADKIVITQDIDKQFFTKDEFLKEACTFPAFIDKLSKICIKYTQE